MAYDFDLYVIGAGSGGVRAARFAAGFGAKVAVAESRYLGGTCVNVGCVPKKLLVYGAHFAEDFEQSAGFGWSLGEANFDWATLIANKNREIQRLNGIYRNLLVDSGVTLLSAQEARTHSAPKQILVDHDAGQATALIAVQCDGVRPSGVRRDYGQHALLTTVRASRRVPSSDST